MSDDQDQVVGYYAGRIPSQVEINVIHKLIDLQDQLIQHSYSGPDDHKLNDNDVIRYSAMVEVLKAVLQ